MIGKNSGGIGNRNGDGPAIRGPRRQDKGASIAAEAARGQCGFLSARRIRKDEGRHALYNVVPSKSQLPAIGREGNAAIHTLGKLPRSPAQGRNLRERSMNVGEAQFFDVVMKFPSGV